MDEGEEGNATQLPVFTDFFTKAPVRLPAISPFGHVCEYDSWTKVLRQPNSKDTCPFTKQPLKRRQLVKLDSENFADYVDKIKNQDEAIEEWRRQQAADSAEA